jgi:two-component system, response regulator PdtaR
MKILIIEDETIIAHDIKDILEKNNYCVCGIADEYFSAKELFLREKPDLIITDIFLKGEKSGIDIARDFLKIKYFPIIFITAYSSDEIINLLFDLQNFSFITKPFTESQVIAAVKIICQRILNTKEHPSITPREKEILELMVKGLKTQKIAEILFISIDTVKSHRKSIFTKYQVNSTPELLNLLFKTRTIIS